MSEIEETSLANIKDGAAIEAFDYELGRVLENILDPNTDPSKERKITLTVKFKPTKDREMGDIYISCEPKLAPATSLVTRLFFGKERGKAVAREHDKAQPHLPMEEPTPLRGIAGGKE